MLIAVVGATGLVGTQILKVLAESSLHNADIMPVASASSVGKTVSYKGKPLTVHSVEQALAAAPDIAIFSAGGSTSLELAPLFATMGTTVIDNSSAWRMNPAHKLIVPEINAHTLTAADKIIANPNCSTIQMVLVLQPLHKAYGIKRVVVSTYQSVTGTGKKAVDQLMNERKGITDGPKAYAHTIDLNLIPHIDLFTENGYTKEEMKMVNETVKIMSDPAVKVTATCVRVPVMGGHSESVNIEFESDFNLDEVRALLAVSPGLELTDDVANLVYPMPLHSLERNEVFVGRIRRDETQANTLNLWIVADNLRKGAATNAVQIAEYLAANKLLKNEEKVLAEN